MSRSALALSLAFVGCTPAVGDDDDASPPPEPTPEPLDCSAAHPLPVEFETVPDIVSAEDFVFGRDGEVFSIDPQGTLVSSTKEGVHTVLVPGVVGASDEGLGAAGISMLPDGDLVIADVGAGALLRVSLDGGRSTVLSGLAYPNGVEVHRDGWVAVSENDTGQVRRVDPDSGEFTLLATDLVAPNGVTFSPDHQTLYVGSFGGGTVHSVDLSDPGAPAIEFGRVDSGSGEPGGDPPPWGWDPWTESCAGLASGEECTLIDQVGTCVGDEFGTWCEAPDPFEAACRGSAAGDVCTLVGAEGLCEDWGDALYCSHPDWFGGFDLGGLDGIATDACGNVYATEFTTGRVYRWGPEGGVAEIAVTLPSGWIPNMDFGSGAGGWDETRLWVNTRDTDEMYGLDIGLPGRPVAHAP